MKKVAVKFGGNKKCSYLCNRLQEVRAFSSAGLEHLPYKQRVGGSNPSTPTKGCFPVVPILDCRDFFLSLYQLFFSWFFETLQTGTQHSPYRIEACSERLLQILLPFLYNCSLKGTFVPFAGHKCAVSRHFCCISIYKNELRKHPSPFIFSSEPR